MNSLVTKYDDQQILNSPKETDDKMNETTNSKWHLLQMIDWYIFVRMFF